MSRKGPIKVKVFSLKQGLNRQDSFILGHDVEHESRKIYDGADFKELSEIYTKNDKIKKRLGIVYLASKYCGLINSLLNLLFF